MQQSHITDYLPTAAPTSPVELRTLAKQRHAAAMFEMLALAEQYKKACNLEEQLLGEANAARSFDRTRQAQRAANLEQMRSGKFEIIDLSAD